ncbi:hypothetical protein I2494_18030 [Budviciaceae bacterium BWR-B9]|uniref:Uncharacterized protein n=1 Tax=Limnobaculum allomyrinae TaxID=2791986 RepID=A0ABS1IV00_9GAMM|nr:MULTISPECIES: hypothetical protein [Limnobaculum]MBK5145581.1 hypothetical protein [Limnobaculum allomyrinae]MBV7693699.1 hypothetical protein [Limnobaculum sp. M2-1]
MSLINHIDYAGVMPDGRKSEGLYTKSLDFGCSFYCISDDNRLLVENDDGTYTDINYDGVLDVYIDDSECHQYLMTFNKGVLISIK